AICLRKSCVCSSPPRGPAGVVDGGVAAGVIPDDCAHVGITKHEFVQESAHLIVYARRRCTMVMSADNVETETITDAPGVIDLFNSPASGVVRRIPQPGEIRVSRREQRTRCDHCRQHMMILR